MFSINSKASRLKIVKKKLFIDVCPALGNLSTKNRIRNRFLAQNPNRLMNRGYSGQFLKQKKRTGIKNGRQDLRQVY
jgi:hypothetical protein